MSEHVQDLIPGYALGILDPAEAKQVEAHLNECGECAQELRVTMETFGSIPMALDPMEPPAGLKDRILTAARAEVTAEQPSLQPESPAPPAPIPLKRRGAARTRINVLGILAAAAVLAFAIGVVIGHHQPGTPQQQYAALVEHAVSNGDNVVALRPVTHGFSGSMAIAVAPSGKTSLLLGPTKSPPSQKVYQLWFIKGKQKPVSLGVWTPNSTEARSVVLAKSARGYTVAAMTVEPSPSGSPGPTSNPFVAATIGSA